MKITGVRKLSIFIYAKPKRLVGRIATVTTMECRKYELHVYARPWCFTRLEVEVVWLWKDSLMWIFSCIYLSILVTFLFNNYSVQRIDTSHCGKALGCARIPPGCQDNTDCDYLLTFNKAATEVEFSVSGKADGWIAVGFNDKPKMVSKILLEPAWLCDYQNLFKERGSVSID